MTKHILFFLSLILITNTILSQENESPAFGDGLFNLVGKDASWTMKIGARIQLLGATTFDSERSSQSNYQIRRARLKFAGYAHTPKLKYKIELGLSNRDIAGASEFTGYAPRYILDAFVKWNFYKNFVLWFGQTKLPGNRERVISSGNMQQVDRSLLNSRFNIDRDFGFQLRHKAKLSNTFIINTIYSLAQGEGRNITTGNIGGFQHTARIELLPMGAFLKKGDYTSSDLQYESQPKLSIAASYDLNNNAVKDRSNQGRYMVNDAGYYNTNITTIFVDAMFKYRGFSFMGEYALRNAQDPIAKNTDGSPTGDIVQVGNGLNLQAGYLIKNNWEASLRYTDIRLDQSITNKPIEKQYTLGISKYIVGHSLKIQSDISYLTNDNVYQNVLYRIQFDLHF